jgi:hypothetical protein
MLPVAVVVVLYRRFVEGRSGDVSDGMRALADRGSGGWQNRQVWMVLACFCFVIAALLKPHLLLFVLVSFCLYLFCLRIPRGWRPVAFIGSMAFLVFVANFAMESWKGRSLREVAEKQQRTFAVAARGGMFLSSGDRYVRMDFDTSSIRPAGGDSLYTIRSGRSFSYWLDAHPDDSLYCAANVDTITVYRMEDASAPGRSNIDVATYGEAPVMMSAYYGMIHPLLLKGKSRLQWVATLENLLIIGMLIAAMLSLWMKAGSGFARTVMIMVFVVLSSFFGFVAPNTGAIMRYRAPVVPFLVCAALAVFRGKEPANSIYSAEGRQLS